MPSRYTPDHAAAKAIGPTHIPLSRLAISASGGHDPVMNPRDVKRPMNDAGSGRLAGFPPVYFSLSMATGIIAIASHLLHHLGIGRVLFWINIAAFAVLWVITLARLALHPQAVLDDFRGHQKGPAFLTIVVATSLIGSQCDAFHLVPWLLPWSLGAALILWCGLLYGFLAAMTLDKVKPDLEHGLNGSWFLIVVATESLAILGSAVLRHGANPPLLGFASLAAWLLGIVLYLMLLALVFYRWTFVPMTDDEISDAWWINMSAAAIVTLAGGELLRTAPLHHLSGFVGPFTIMFWAVAAFWIPLLAIVFAHKYLFRWPNLHYQPGVWSAVFPLGMFTTATALYARDSGLAFLHRLAGGFYWLALASWVLSALGLIHHLLFGKTSA
jgi:tellurite resistance protein TehA-like permease